MFGTDLNDSHFIHSLKTGNVIHLQNMIHTLI